MDGHHLGAAMLRGAVSAIGLSVDVGVRWRRVLGRRDPGVEGHHLGRGKLRLALSATVFGEKSGVRRSHVLVDVIFALLVTNCAMFRE